MRRTTREIASALAVEEEAARGLVKFLLACNPPQALFRGERRPANGGRGQFVYEIVPGAGALAQRMITRLEQ